MSGSCPPDFVPLILDFDASVLPLGRGETRFDLGGWQEAVRFGCGHRTFARLEDHIGPMLPRERGCVFLGSGDFHHLTLLLLRRLAKERALPAASMDLVVCDNHPDNMRYFFGLHCGSWVRHAAALDCVRAVHIIGIHSPDITLPHAWENYLSPFVRNKLHYWSVGVSAAWLGILGRAALARRFDSADALVSAFASAPGESVYLSIDKDVLSPRAAPSTWDQGVFEPEHLDAIIRACAERLCGVDVCGDVSHYAYRSPLKRFLSRLDGLRGPDEPGAPRLFESMRERHREINQRLLSLLSSSTGSRAATPTTFV